MTEVLFGENAQPVQIDLDDEVSISTACLIKHVAKTRRGPPPSASKLVRSTRRTRSMDRISPPRTEQSSSTPLVRSRARRSIRKTTRTEEDDTLAVTIDDAATDDIPDEVLPLPTDDKKPEVAKETEEPEEIAKSDHESPAKETPEPVVEEIAPSRPKRAQPKAKAATTTRKRRVVQAASVSADEEKTSPVKEASPKVKRSTRAKAAAKAIKLIDGDNDEKEEEQKPTRRTRKTTETKEEAAPVKKNTRKKKPSKDEETKIIHLGLHLPRRL